MEFSDVGLNPLNAGYSCCEYSAVFTTITLGGYDELNYPPPAGAPDGTPTVGPFGVTMGLLATPLYICLGNTQWTLKLKYNIGGGNPSAGVAIQGGSVDSPLGGYGSGSSVTPDSPSTSPTDYWGTGGGWENIYIGEDAEC
jgi:hypothetical protein